MAFIGSEVESVRAGWPPLLRSPQAGLFDRPTIRWRWAQVAIYEHTKWVKRRTLYVTADSLPLYKRFLDNALGSDGGRMFCFVADRNVADRNVADPIVRWGTQRDAYAKMTEQLIIASVSGLEVVTVLADQYSTPRYVTFEENVRSAVIRRLGRLAAVSVTRLDSRSSDGLQVTDLVTSSIAHEFRSEVGLAATTNAKAALSKHALGLIGAQTCLQGWSKRLKLLFSPFGAQVGRFGRPTIRFAHPVHVSAEKVGSSRGSRVGIAPKWPWFES